MKTPISVEEPQAPRSSKCAFELFLPRGSTSAVPDLSNIPAIDPLRWILFGILIFLISAQSGCQGQDHSEQPPSAPLFADMFHAIQDNLIKNCWVGNGDWRGDMQGDDVAFGPWLFYSIGEDCGIPEFVSMATRTVDYEVSQLEKLFSGGMWNPMKMMKTVVGGPALIEGYRFTENPEYLQWADTGLEIGTGIALMFPRMLAPVVLDPAVVVGVTADLDFELFGITLDSRYSLWGLAAMDAAEGRFWNEEGGYYGDTLWDWPEATMLMALAQAFKATADPLYRARAEIVSETADREFWDPEDSGYYGHDPVVPESKALSGNNLFAQAMLDWYEITGDSSYIERAIRIQGFLQRVLYSKGILWHHWTAEEGVADYSCTGCNLMALGNIYRLNRLRGTPLPCPFDLIP